jgi:hypothetical protein
MPDYQFSVFPQHQELLAASAITTGVARARGYVSADSKAQLGRYGFGPGQRNVPALVIPLRRVDGSIWGYQARPDIPRVTPAGKAIKYETPAKQRNGIDIPPPVREQMGDPAVPLFITEGSRKADSAVSHGLCCVALPGVWGWRGSNGQGGKAAVADWHDIALNDRRVVLAFDSDVTVKPAVAKALAELARYLEGKGAKAEYLHLPDEGEGKCGLDDYLAGHGAGDIWPLVHPEPPALRETADGASPPIPSAVASHLHTLPAWAGDPAELLDDVLAWLRSYAAFASGYAATAITLWAAHTHLADHFGSTPRLALLSPEKQCGKTRVLELLELVCAGAETLSDASPAYLYRRIDAGHVTILLDEADAIWKRGKKDESAEALRSIINAGHRRSATVGRVEMNGQGGAKLTRFRVYAPAAIAAIGSLPDTITDRAVVVHMRRRAPDEQVRGYRERTTRPEGEALRGQLAAWAASVAGQIGGSWPEMPAGVTDRAADVWEALIVIADLAGGRWPELARQACTAFVNGARDDTETVGTRLLADLREMFGDSPAMSTEAILTRLHSLDEAPWGDWYGKPLDARGLAKLLRPYEVRSRQVRLGDVTVKGYRREDLQVSWRSYLARGSETSETSETPLASHVSDVSLVSDKRAGEPADDGDPFAPTPEEVALIASLMKGAR